MRLALHFPIGMVGAVLTLWHPPSGIMLMVYFICYEVLNDWRKKDSSYKDVIGGALGFGLTSLILFVINLLA